MDGGNEDAVMDNNEKMYEIDEAIKAVNKAANKVGTANDLEHAQNILRTQISNLLSVAEELYHSSKFERDEMRKKIHNCVHWNVINKEAFPYSISYGAAGIIGTIIVKEINSRKTKEETPDEQQQPSGRADNASAEEAGGRIEKSQQGAGAGGV